MLELNLFVSMLKGKPNARVAAKRAKEVLAERVKAGHLLSEACKAVAGGATEGKAPIPLDTVHYYL